MSTNIVHVLTIIGKGAEQVEAACEGLLGRRIERHSKVYGSDDWSERDHKDLEELCVTLMDCAPKLPVVYSAQYLDGWSVADSRFSLLEWPDGRRRQIYGAMFGLTFYPSKYGQDFLAQIRRRRRTKVYRTQSEDRWFLDQIREAIGAA